jgi:hypothetical protein
MRQRHIQQTRAGIVDGNGVSDMAVYTITLLSLIYTCTPQTCALCVMLDTGYA